MDCDISVSAEAGARHWAIANTLIQTCKLNNVEPLAYLTDVLQRIVSGRTKSHELRTLLPWDWHPDFSTGAIPDTSSDRAIFGASL